MLERLKQAVIANENVFVVLVDAVRVCSLGQITHALFEVGGAVPPEHVSGLLPRSVCRRLSATPAGVRARHPQL